MRYGTGIGPVGPGMLGGLLDGVEGGVVGCEPDVDGAPGSDGVEDESLPLPPQATPNAATIAAIPQTPSARAVAFMVAAKAHSGPHDDQP